MPAFNLSTAFVAFLAVLGPQKVLLTFAQLARDRTHRELIQLAAVSTLIAAAVGLVLAYSADFLADLFHITDASLLLAGGVIFFSYAVALVLGVHLGGNQEPTAHPSHRLTDGVRELLLPYIASPLAITVLLVEALDKSSAGWRTTIAGAYEAVLAIDFLSVVLLAPLLQRSERIWLEVLNRLLGLLLAAVGVEQFLYGLRALGVAVTQSKGH